MPTNESTIAMACRDLRLPKGRRFFKDSFIGTLNSIEFYSTDKDRDYYYARTLYFVSWIL